MSDHRLDFERLRALLRRHEDEPAVLAALGDISARIDRDGAWGELTLPEHGLAVTLCEVAHDRPELMQIASFDLFGPHPTGRPAFAHRLPGGVTFGDTIDHVQRSISGTPQRWDQVHPRIAVRDARPWIGYFLDDDKLHFQFDASGRLASVSLYTREDMVWR